MLDSDLKALVTFPAGAIGVGLGAFTPLGEIKAGPGVRREDGSGSGKAVEDTPMKRLVVELFDSARRIASVAEVELELEEEATVRDMLRALATSYPALRGPVIDPEGWSARPYILLNLDGKETIEDDDLELPHRARVLLMSALAGGSG
ncbi:MAG: MoaD/ThiS family protein [Rhodospirillales bacterium]|jgi:molybdopterin converting factor small subunit|nr:MoaD/ThiS family protein [Rhodospirillales bacterium]